MNKFFAVIAFALAGAAFAQEETSINDVPAEESAVETAAVPAEEPEAAAETVAAAEEPAPVAETAAPTAAPEKDEADLPAPKRPTYNFRSFGFGVAVWHNWQDKEYNPKRDWNQGFTLHHGRIWEMTSFAAITWMSNTEATFGDYWQWGATSRIGGRFYFADKLLSPFVGLGVGLGVQVDGHYDHLDEMFAVGLAGGAEAGLTIFKTSQTQLELGCSYDFSVDYFDFNRMFGSFNFYIAINY